MHSCHAELSPRLKGRSPRTHRAKPTLSSRLDLFGAWGPACAIWMRRILVPVVCWRSTDWRQWLRDEILHEFRWYFRWSYNSGPLDTVLQVVVAANYSTDSRGHFEVDAWERRSHCWKAAGTNRNSVTIVRTQYGRHCEPSSGQKMHYIAGFCIYNLKFFRGLYPRTPQKRLRCLDPAKHQFPLVSPAFPLFWYYETTTADTGKSIYTTRENT